MICEKIKKASLCTVAFLLTAAGIFNCTGCGKKASDSSTANAERPKLTADSLEESPYQDFIPGINGEEPVQLKSGYYVTDQVYADMEQENYSLPDHAEFQLNLHNETGGLLTADCSFELEILLDDIWYTVPPRCDIIEMQEVDIGEETTFLYDLSRVDVEFIDGTYRVLKIYREQKEEGKMLLVGAEFQLTVT